MTTLVLVHGAWAGGWIWKRLEAPLRGAGHDVHALTLTGLGERGHLASRVQPPIDLATHIQDVLAHIEAEELRELVLVGHSYGGMVVTGAADRLIAAGSVRVAGIVYVDAVLPEPGESWSSTHSPETVQDRIAQGQAAGGFIPTADPKAFGMGGADRDWLLRRQRPQPLATYTEALDFDAARVASPPRLYIDCVQPALGTIDPSRRRAHAQGLRIVTLATGHCPQVTMPGETAQAMVEFIRTQHA